MQLLIATLSTTALSYIIGCTNSNDIWTNLKDIFSTITKASIFQMKTELHNIKKGSENISQYLQRIKDARDHLSAAGISFDDDDIIILALKGLPPEYNTFRTVIRGRESVISLKDFRARLLDEETTVEHAPVSESFSTAMLAQEPMSKGKALMLGEGSSHSTNSQYHPGSSSGGYYNTGTYNNNFGGSYNTNSGSYRGPNFRGRARGRNHFGNNSRFLGNSSNNSPGILGPVRPHVSTCPEHSNDIPVCQICNKRGHIAVDCFQRHRGHIAADCFQRHSSTTVSSSPVQCQICWKFGHSAMQCYHRANFSYQGRSPPSSITAMHTNYQPSAPQEQFWVADTGATSHLTSNLSNLTLATPLTGTDTITTASGAGKFTKLPFSYPANKTVKPLEVIHSDV
ncbi:hypothetical protein ACFX12_029902 [Malus domestica]